MYSDTVKPKDLPSSFVQLKPGEKFVPIVPRRFFVVGPAGSGKSEFARMLASELCDRMPNRIGCGPVVLGECGEILIKLLAEQLSVGSHKLANDHNSLEDWIAHIRQWKARYRAQLRWLGDLLSIAQPGFLPRAALGRPAPAADGVTRICVGVRRAIECRAVLAQGDVWILVQRAGVEPVQDSFDLKFFYAFCKVKIENDGDLAALRFKAKAFVETL